MERYANRACLVSSDGSVYSVPAAWAQKMLLVKQTEDRQLIILNGLGEVVAQHHRLPGRHKRVIVAAHDAELPVLARPTAVPQAIQSVTGAPELGLSGGFPQVEARPLSVYAQLSALSHD